ncbi:MAG: histidinol-phosphatase [Micropepsaceae bacterium]
MTAALSFSEIDDLKAFALELADVSGRIILPFFRRELAVENKLATAGFDPVTQADRDAETAVRALIKQRHPSHGVLGEELGFEAGTVPLTWVIDPIDGTRAFMCGMAQWGTLIALNDGTRPVVGLLDQPYTQERWIAANGTSQFQRRGEPAQRLHTRSCTSLNGATLSTTSPVGYFDDNEQRAFWALSNEVRLTRFGGDCYGYGLLAMGFIDIIVEAALKPWDVQALIPIVENAGGVMSTWDGGPCNDGGQVVACGDPSLHKLVLQVLADAR